MIRNSSRNSCLGRLAAVLLAALTGSVAHAQTTQTTPPAATHHNVLRLDVGGILARNLAYSMLNSNPQPLLPLLVGYERQLGLHTSGNAEVLLNGGTPRERTTGFALQGRYYFHQRRQVPLWGFYVAPTAGYRAIRQDSYYQQEVNRKLLGGGALLGAQVMMGARRRLVLDVSGGVMSWTRLNKPDASSLPMGYYEDKSFYENSNALFDGRISLGYRF